MNPAFKLILKISRDIFYTISALIVYMVPSPAFSEKTSEGWDGIWTHVTLTPIERPEELGGKRAYTEDEVLKIESTEKNRLEKEQEPTPPAMRMEELAYECRPGFRGSQCGYNGFWLDTALKLLRVGGEARTSILTQPENGRIPYRSQDMRKIELSTDGPEGRSLSERCLQPFGGAIGPVILPTVYGNYYRFMLTQDYFTIISEMNHDTRIIPLKKQKTSSLRKWWGQSSGSFAGNQISVETKKFHRLQKFFASSENLVVNETFTLLSSEEIRYDFTVTDDRVYTQAWKGSLIFRKTPKRLFEYACHEGNEAIRNILEIERKLEKEIKK